MDEQERKLFKQIKGHLGENYQPGDDYLIERMAVAVLKVRKYEAKIAEEGEIVAFNNGTTKGNNQLLTFLKQYASELSTVASKLGLAPADRKKIDGSAKNPKSAGRKPKTEKDKIFEEIFGRKE